MCLIFKFIYWRLTFHPDVDGRSDGEDEKEDYEHKRLEVIGRHTLDTKENGPKQLALRSVKAVT